MLSSLVSQALPRVYGRYGIGIPEWRVLVTLGENGVMTGKAVGAHTHMHKTKVSRAVAQLEQRKFLSRRANREDLRESFLSLTPAGRAVYEELAPNDSWCIMGDSGDDVPSGRHSANMSQVYRNSPQSYEYRMKGRGNFCFFDGHIELLSPDDLLRPLKPIPPGTRGSEKYHFPLIKGDRTMW